MTPLPSRRRDKPIALEVTSGTPDSTSRVAALAARDRLATPLVTALLAGLVAAAGGWVLVAGFVVAGWLSGGGASLTSALEVASQGWLAAHGGAMEISGARWSLIPLGITAICGVLIGQTTAFAARQRLAGTDGSSPQADLWRAAARATGASAGVYAVVVAIVGFLVGSEEQATRALVGAALLASACGGLSALRTLRVGLFDAAPMWWRGIPRAVGAGVGTLALGATILLIIAVVRNWDQIAAINASLQPGIVGTVALTVWQMAYLPNAIIWVMSWLLGAGFSVGAETFVAPSGTQLGIVPALPALGALPAEGPPSVSAYWWLAAGALAGVVAAVIVVRARPRDRFDTTVLSGGLAGALSGVVVAGLGLLSSGGLGAGRLADVGPPLAELLIMGVSTLGIAGLLTGVAVAAWRLWQHRHAPADTSE